MRKMDPNFEAMIQDFRQFSQLQIKPGVFGRDQKSEFPLEIFQQLYSQGWLKAAAQKEYGGTEIQTSQLIHWAREMATVSSGIFISSLGHILGQSPLFIFGSKDLRKKLAPDKAPSLSLWSFCMTEPAAGTDIFNIQTHAKRVPGGFLLTGQKHLITNASFSDHLSVFAKLWIPEKQKEAISVFYVPAGTTGVKRGDRLEKFGLRESNTGGLIFSEVFVPEENLIGEPGQGIEILYRCIQKSKTLIAAAAVGICDRALQLAQERLNGRISQGKSLLDRPVISSMLAQLHTEARAAWLLTCEAAAAWDAGEPAIKEASMAKLFAADVAVKTVSETMELHGGYSYNIESEIQRLYRDVKALEIVEGASFVQQALIARELFRESKSPAVKLVKTPMASAA